MKVDLDFLAKLFAPFHTETGKKIALEYVKRKNVNPACIVALPAANEQAEPKGDKEQKGKEAFTITNDVGLGMIDKERLLKIQQLAREEAKPTLLKKDIERLGEAIEADKWYFYQQRGYTEADSHVRKALRLDDQGERTGSED
jgi:3,4-dihydroxy-2-butanone 4-phosphate synthase